MRYPVVVGVIAFGLLNPDPAYAPTFQTTPEDRPSLLERAGEIGLAAAVGAIGVRIGQAESGPKIRNKHLAGEVHPGTGVPFDEHGFPDFRAAGVVEREVKIKYTGTRAGDYKAANDAAGLETIPDGRTWHHHQDGTTMQMIPEDIHQRTGHTGGYGLSKKQDHAQHC